MYVDLNEDDLPADVLAMEEEPTFGRRDSDEPLELKPSKPRREALKVEPAANGSITDAIRREIEADITFRTPSGAKAAWLKSPRPPKMGNGVPVLSPFSRIDRADHIFGKD